MSDPKCYGSIFYDRAKKKKQYPDARGDFTINREMFDAIAARFVDDDEVKINFAGWTREGPKAGKYLSGQLELPREASSSTNNNDPVEIDDDDLPF